jgi:hypothetical protein
MGRGPELSRRSLIHSLLGWLCIPPTFIAAAQEPPGKRGAASFRCYRVDATVLVCGIPVFVRKGVGGGYAAVETSTTGEAAAVALQFAAGSWPDRSSGLNRFGVLQEVVINRQTGRPDCCFRGLITASKEEDLGEVRKALRSSARTVEVILARGLASGGHMRTWTEAAAIPPDHTWVEASAMLGGLVRDEPRDGAHEVEVGGATTFLAAMRSAALWCQLAFDCPFVHAGKLYALEASRRAGAPGELTGVIRNNRGHKSAEFRVSYAAGDGSGIPIRIEYRPKSFLRLIFECEADGPQPAIASLFKEETL